MSLTFALGSNGSGQLGVGHTDDVSIPTHVLGITDRSVNSLAAGGNHSVILLSNGTIKTTGEHDGGRCFSITKDEAKQAGLFAHPESLAQSVHTCQHVAATWSASFVVYSNGAVLVSGEGTNGELGLGKGVIQAEEPRLMEGFPPTGVEIVKLAACMAHVVAVLSNGEVWGWGQGKKGQLGEPMEIVWKPRKISGIDFFATDAACGKDFTCIVGHPVKGELVVLGLAGKDRFGVTTGAPKDIPDWKQIAASWGSVFVLFHNGRLIGWGRDDHDQLPPEGLPPLISIAAGSEHCLGISERGNVLAWGWGEHGNCGQPIDRVGNAFGRWNEFRLHHSALAVFAGCATSFVVTNSEPDAR